MVRSLCSYPTASGLSKAAIQQVAEDIARKYDYDHSRNIREIVEILGGEISIENTLVSDPEKSGSLYVKGKRNFKIILPSHTSIERDNFTIAHELGHYFLHYVYKVNKGETLPDFVAGRKGSDRPEWEANWFAGAFLMPEDVFREKYNQENGNLLAVSDFFNVSVSAAEVRAISLGLLGQ